MATIAEQSQRLAAERGCDPYDILNEEAAEIPIGSDGLVLLDHFQGNRTPYSDSRSCGVSWACR